MCSIPELRFKKNGDAGAAHSALWSKRRNWTQRGSRKGVNEEGELALESFLLSLSLSLSLTLSPTASPLPLDRDTSDKFLMFTFNGTMDPLFFSNNPNPFSLGGALRTGLGVSVFNC